MILFLGIFVGEEMEIKESEYCNLQEAAEKIGESRDHVISLIREGELQAYARLQSYHPDHSSRYPVDKDKYTFVGIKGIAVIPGDPEEFSIEYGVYDTTNDQKKIPLVLKKKVSDLPGFEGSEYETLADNTKERGVEFIEAECIRIKRIDLEQFKEARINTTKHLPQQDGLSYPAETIEQTEQCRIAPTEEPWVTEKTIAKHAGVGVRQIRNWIRKYAKDRDYPFFNIVGQKAVYPSALNTFMKKHKLGNFRKSNKKTS